MNGVLCDFGMPRLRKTLTYLFRYQNITIAVFMFIIYFYSYSMPCYF